MIDPVTTIVSLVKVSFCFFLLFVGLPLLVLQFTEEDSMLKRVFIAMIHSSLLMILVVHLLVILHLFEPFSVFFCVCAALFLAYKYIRPPAVVKHEKILLATIDWVDSQEGWKNQVRHYLNKFRRIPLSYYRAAVKTVQRNKVWSLLFLAAFAVAGYVRFHHALTHLAFGSYDPYVHLDWSKQLTENKIYVDGVYPYGFESIIAGMGNFFSLDQYYITRYLGALDGMLILLSLLFFIRENFKREKTGMLLAVIVIGTGVGLPMFIWREISALSMEHSLIFFLPGIHFLNLYFRRGKLMDLIIAGEVLMTTVLIHAFSAVCLGIGYLLILVCYADKWFRTKTFMRTTAVLGTAGAIGVLPLFIGLAAGISFHSTSINYIRSSVKVPGQPFSIGKFAVLFWSDAGLGIMAAGAFAIVIYAVASRSNKEYRLSHSGDRMGLVVLLFAATLFLLYDAADLGLPVLMPKERMGIFFALACAPVIPLFLRLFDIVRWTKISMILKFMVLAGAVAAMIHSGGFQVPVGFQIQYDSAALNYLSIKNEYRSDSWNIVSPVEELPLIRNYGSHLELSDFVQRLSDPAEKSIQFQSNHVFFFVEKIPLSSNKEVTPEEALLPFPKLNGDATTFYYRTPVNRRILEAKAYAWAEKYRQTHKYMTVYYDSPELRVYEIKQDYLNPFNLKQ